MRDRIDGLAELASAAANLDAHAIALGMRSAAYTASRLSFEKRVEVAWTGRGTDAVPLRRVDQVIYEILESATKEILLVTYAAYRAERALQALQAATSRGVSVTLVLELAQKSGGTLPFDTLEAIRQKVPDARVHSWPLEQRPQNSSGTYGSMHVKCLVADRRVAFVSSANLTDNALDLNMELGLLAYGDVPRQLAEHFQQLIIRGEFLPLEVANKSSARDT